MVISARSGGKVRAVGAVERCTHENRDTLCVVTTDSHQTCNLIILCPTIKSFMCTDLMVFWVDLTEHEMAVAAAREAALNRLVNWCQKKDPQFFLRADCVKAVVDIRSDVHMVATQDIPAKTTLVIIPSSLTIASDTVTHATALKRDYVELERKIKELYKGQLVDGDGEAFQPAGEWAGLGRGGIVTKEARR